MAAVEASGDLGNNNEPGPADTLSRRSVRLAGFGGIGVHGLPVEDSEGSGMAEAVGRSVAHVAQMELRSKSGSCCIHDGLRDIGKVV
jgi:hypothetical protein